MQAEADLDEVLDDIQPLVLLVALVHLRSPESIFQQLPDVLLPFVRPYPFQEGVFERPLDIGQREVRKHDGHFSEGVAMLLDELFQHLQPAFGNFLDFVPAVPNVQQEFEFQFLHVLALEVSVDVFDELLKLVAIHVGVLVEGSEKEFFLALVRELPDFFSEGLKGLLIAPLEEVV